MSMDQLPQTDEFSAAFDNLTVVDDKGAAAPAAAEDGDAGAVGTAAEAGGDAGAAGAGGDAGGDAGVASAEAGTGGDPPAGEPGAGADDAGAAAAPGAEGADAAKAAAAAPAAGAPPPPPAASAVDTNAVLDEIARRVKAEPAAAAPAAEPEPTYNEAEQAILTNFEKEWPEVHAALPLINRSFGRALLAYAFSEIRKEFDPIKEMVESMALRTHVSDIEGAIGKYDNNERDAIIAWVDEQPTYLQNAYKGVIEDGTAKEIGDLVGRFREATGRVVIPPTQDPPGGDTELSEEAKKAAAALAPVGSKRSVVQQTEDPNDFDGAFTKFAAQTEKV